LETLDLFLYVTLPLLFTLLILIVTTYLGMIKPLTEINERTKRIETDMKEGLINVVKTVTNTDYIKTLRGNSDDPLTAAQIKRRDELLERGRRVGLTRDEVAELKVILEEGARETAAGNALAFLGFLFLIGLLLAALSRE
jgi:hypothetical protein